MSMEEHGQGGAGRRGKTPAEEPGALRHVQVGDIPRGIEVLVKKAAVDREFRELLVEARARAAGEIGLELSPAEAAMLDAIPASQLEAIIARTKVDRKARRAFLGKAAAVMIAALGVGTSSCIRRGATKGIRPSGRPRRSAGPESEKKSGSQEAGQE